MKFSKEVKTNDREIVIVRIIDAPRELVFNAFIDPKHIAKWWGPRGFTNTIHEMDVRVGGYWRFIMHGPDGTDYTNWIKYLEIVKNELLVMDHGGNDPDKAEFHAVITFEDDGLKTKLTMRSVFESPDALEAVKKFGAVEGGNQTLDKLAEFLAQQK